MWFNKGYPNLEHGTPHPCCLVSFLLLPTSLPPYVTQLEPHLENDFTWKHRTWNGKYIWFISPHVVISILWATSRSIRAHYDLWVKLNVSCAAKKRSFKIFVVVIPKEGFFFWYDTNFTAQSSYLHNTISEGCRLQIYSWCHTKRRIDNAMPANPSFDVTSTKIFKVAAPLDFGLRFPWNFLYWFLRILAS